MMIMIKTLIMIDNDHNGDAGDNKNRFGFWSRLDVEYDWN